MIIETLSDIHLHMTATPPGVDTRSMAGMDFYPYIPKPNGFGDLLIIAGDVGPWDEDAAPFLQQLAEEVQLPVLFVPGNHEFEQAIPLNRQFISPHPNVTILQHGDTHVRDNYCFIGATLWSDSTMSPKERTTSAIFHDFLSINSPTRVGEKISLKEYVDQHHRERVAVLGACRTAHAKGLVPIVITHHAPSFDSTHVSFIGNRFNFLFASDMNDDILALGDAAPPLWVHGHMHNPTDYRIGKTRVINQPLGYTGEMVAGTSASHWRAIDLERT